MKLFRAPSTDIANAALVWVSMTHAGRSLREPRVLHLLSRSRRGTMPDETTRYCSALYRAPGDRTPSTPFAARRVRPRTARPPPSFVEHLVEVTHPEEKDRVLVTRLDLPVLLHEGRGRLPRRHGDSASVTKASIFFVLSVRATSAAALRDA